MSRTVCLSFDFDAMSVWFGFERTTPAMLARGEYGARVAVPRLLALLKRHAILATFFTPGHTLESFPDAAEAILSDGHELAHHSYAHQDPSGQTLAQERDDMARAWRCLERLGVTPRGFRSPSADFSPNTLSLIEEFGFLYDSSLMADDFSPYQPRIGDVVGAYTPLQRGRPAKVWEIPMSFELDDWPHFQFNFTPYRAGLSAASKVEEIWRDEFDHMPDGGVMTIAMHPQVIGRVHRMAMLERLIVHYADGGARFARMVDVAEVLPRVT
jgi:peptidoglycan-N-acetylglucosamine deacetylase